ncbi:hypothetical protein K227x_27960 [Rubripirellula lacrimiformis]|uniref:Uncharacterized protein n=1 Tax=Rubripirellula lacrimiformis TaxID=1930273 RepID=A0A517NB97_9BACT|nr:hypothetical protein [Rubripirellula lacrimiformis]QDT04405.1 hypothetical protein K227x_27960 [Rubripirellula lacrimiformis]
MNPRSTGGSDNAASKVSFLSHTLAADEPEGDYELLSPEAGETENDDVPAHPLRDAGVGRVLLLHGTFAGDDAMGMIRGLARIAPGSAAWMSELAKRWVDQVIGDVGNFTDAYARSMSIALNRKTETAPPGFRGAGASQAGAFRSMEPDAGNLRAKRHDHRRLPIVVERLRWSGENHTLGRAQGALQLFDRLIDSRAAADRRTLILAHSHGGNVMAMLSQLIAADPAARQAFYQQAFHPQAILRNDRIADETTNDAIGDTATDPVGNPVHTVWGTEEHQRRFVELDLDRLPTIDVATFGVPLRYRWNTTVCGRILHFVQHRSLDAEHETKAVLPQSINDIIAATAGDYAQHVGIAGTDFPALGSGLLESVADIRRNRILRDMFEVKSARSGLIDRLRLGRRRSIDGKTLLVDYPDDRTGRNRKLFGHGIYTNQVWMPFHLRQIADRLYRQRIVQRSMA